ncbi:MAG: hypothetical protein AAF797_02365 [Planctomycetota bacterium]
MNGGRVIRRLMSAVVMAVVLVGAGGADAGSRVYGDVTVSIEEPMSISGSTKGYSVYRMTVTNTGGEVRRVRVQLPGESYGGYGDRLASLSKTVRVEPGSSVNTELLQPRLSLQGDGAAVWIDGSRQQQTLPLTLVSLSEYYGGALTPVQILASRRVDEALRTGFQRAVDELESRSSSGSSWSGYSSTPATMVRMALPPGEWSGNWLAYTGFDAVMISDREFDQLSVEANGALRSYVEAGGFLVLTGERAVPSMPRAWSGAWVLEGDGTGEMRVGLGRVVLGLERSFVRFNTDQWEDRFSDWRLSGRMRGVAPDAQSAESALPMLERLDLPVRGLLGLMLVFTLVIGPVNVLVLSKLKKRMWLLWTVPLLAVLFGGGVLGYSIVSEGVRPRARTVAVTVLDQTTRRSVTLGGTGYYAPLTPGDGLRYPLSAEVTPCVEDIYGYYGGWGSDAGRPRRMDVTTDQHMSEGWIVARVPAHLVVRLPEVRRERLDIRPAEGGGLSVVNGLGKPIRRLVIADAQGMIYRLGSIAAGASAVSGPGEPRQEGHLRTRSPLEEAVSASPMLAAANLEGMTFENADTSSFPASTYLAVLDNDSFLEPGLDNLVSHEVRGVVIGYWREGE